MRGYIGLRRVSAGDMAAGEGSTESLNLVAEKEAITEPFLEKNICFGRALRDPGGTVFTRHLSSMGLSGNSDGTFQAKPGQGVQRSGKRRKKRV